MDGAEPKTLGFWANAEKPLEAAPELADGLPKALLAGGAGAPNADVRGWPNDA